MANFISFPVTPGRIVSSLLLFGYLSGGSGVCVCVATESTYPTEGGTGGKKDMWSDPGEIWIEGWC